VRYRCNAAQYFSAANYGLEWGRGSANGPCSTPYGFTRPAYTGLDRPQRRIEYLPRLRKRALRPVGQ